ncbi:MAG: acetyl-CoA carboxylase biotin carboxyl carrier protein [Cyclobacteriaceae bacterium]
MKAKELQELIDFISSTGLEEVDIETEAFKIKVKRSSDAPVVHAAAPAQVAAPAPAPAPVTSAAPPAAEVPAPSSNTVEIKSPMIGTFYEASNPETPAFVKVGDVIKPGDTVCIVEAMKLFNEIESEVSGKVVKILVDNASPVEYDQPLFLVEPA